MPAYVAWWLFAADVTTWVFYYVERRVVKRKHLKFVGTQRHILALHVIAGTCETVVGLVSILKPANVLAARSAAIVALAVHIPTNLLLAPHVWGLKYITVSGYVMVALLRAWEAHQVSGDGTDCTAASAG